METRLRITSLNTWSKSFYQYFSYLKKGKHLYFSSKLLEVEICGRIPRKTKNSQRCYSHCIRVNPRWRHPWEVIRAKIFVAIDVEPCMTELVAQKEEMSRLKNKTSIESDHVQNSPVVNVLFSVLTMIRNQLAQNMRSPGVHL